MNNCTFIGNLTRDCKTGTTREQKAYVTFSLAINEGRNRAVTYVDCIYSGNVQNIAPYLTKGKKVAVMGSVKAEAYLAQDGTARGTLNCSVRSLELLSANDRAERLSESDAPSRPTATPQPQTTPQPTESYTFSQEIPF